MIKQCPKCKFPYCEGCGDGPEDSCLNCGFMYNDRKKDKEEELKEMDDKQDFNEMK